MKLRNRMLLWITVALLCTPLIADAITVLEPNGIGNEKIAEGVEFSTYVKGNRWDMSDAADVITSESRFLTNETISNGIYRATSVEDNSPDGLTDAKFFLTYQGLSSAVLSLESGQKFPIDTSVYSQISIKIRHLDSGGSPTNSEHPVQVFFFENQNSIRDATFGYTSGQKVMSDGDWHVVQIDLIDDLSPSSNYSWTDFSEVKGLRIDPTTYANTRIEVDWVRLTAPGDAGTRFNVQWSGGAGPYSVAARRQNDIPVTLASDIEGTSADIDFSVLPGGDYTIEVSDAQDTGFSTAGLRVNEAPLFEFLQPDIKGDVAKRYSLVEVGNPWGPVDAADVAATKLLTAISYSSPAGSLTATSTGSDSHVLLNTPQAIDTLKYRMMSFTLSVGGARDIGKGSVARLFWGDSPGTAKTSEDIIVQEGLNTYELGDMHDLRVEGGPANQWQGSPTYFRIDPHEFSTPKNIRLDDVTLAPFDTAAPTFNVTWLDSDSDDNASIELYADSDRIPGNGNEVLIASGVSEDASTDSFSWAATDHVVEGEYHLYSSIDDGFNQTTRYATGPIKVVAGVIPDPDITFRSGFED